MEEENFSIKVTHKNVMRNINVTDFCVLFDREFAAFI